jgi:hypothetical protein
VHYVVSQPAPESGVWLDQWALVLQPVVHETCVVPGSCMLPRQQQCDLTCTGLPLAHLTVRLWTGLQMEQMIHTFSTAVQHTRVHKARWQSTSPGPGQGKHFSANFTCVVSTPTTCNLHCRCLA